MRRWRSSVCRGVAGRHRGSCAACNHAQRQLRAAVCGVAQASPRVVTASAFNARLFNEADRHGGSGIRVGLREDSVCGVAQASPRVVIAPASNARLFYEAVRHGGSGIRIGLREDLRSAVCAPQTACVVRSGGIARPLAPGSWRVGCVRAGRCGLSGICSTSCRDIAAGVAACVSRSGEVLVRLVLLIRALALLSRCSHITRVCRAGARSCCEQRRIALARCGAAPLVAPCCVIAHTSAK